MHAVTGRLVVVFLITYIIDYFDFYSDRNGYYKCAS